MVGMKKVVEVISRVRTDEGGRDIKCGGDNEGSRD